MAIRWDNPEDWDKSQSEQGTAHETLAYTDHSNAGTLRQGYSYGDLREGLVAYYPMEQGQSTHLHDAALRAHGDIRGAEWTSQTQFGDFSLDFQASNNDDVDLGRNYRYTEGGSWTISVHFYSRDVSSTRQFVTDNGTDKSNNNTPITRNLGYRNSNLTVYTGGGGTWVYGNTTLSNDTWYHAVYRYNGDGTLTFYLDGDDDGNVNVQSDSSSYCDIGYLMSKNGSRYHDGFAKDMRVYDRALSEPEIQTLYNLGKVQGQKKSITNAVAPNAQVARYALDGDATDSWGTNDGTNNGVSFVNDALYGQAGEFDESSNIVSGSTVDLFTEPSASISAWVNADSIASDNNARYVAGVENDGNNHYYIILDNNAIGAFLQEGSNNNIIRGEVSANTGEWYHVVIVANDSEHYVYRNGKLAAKQSHSFDLTNIGAGDLSIGARLTGGASDYLDGTADDIRFYSRALTPLEVEKLFHRGFHRIQRRYTV